jgi:hypothetical protein
MNDQYHLLVLDKFLYSNQLQQMLHAQIEAFQTVMDEAAEICYRGYACRLKKWCGLIL